MCKVTFRQSEHVRHIRRVLPSTRTLPDLAPLFVSVWCDHALRGAWNVFVLHHPMPSLEPSNYDYYYYNGDEASFSLSLLLSLFGSDSGLSYI